MKIFEPKLMDRMTDAIKKFSDQSDYIEIRLEETHRLSVNYNEKGIKRLGQEEKIGGCVRACINGGWGFSSFTDLSNINVSANEAIKAAKLLGKGKTVLAEIPIVQERVSLDLLNDPRKRKLADKLDIFENYLACFKRYPSERLKACRITYTEEFKGRVFASSEGSFISQENLAMDLTFVAIAIQNGIPTMMMRILNNARDADFILNKYNLINEVCAEAVLFSDAKPMPAGEFPVILDSVLAGTLAHESFGHTSEADLFASSPGGRETLRLGRQFGRECLNIYDSGLINDYSGSMKYDDEGVASCHTKLIENGTLVGRLHNRETAAEFNEPVTGNARAVGYWFPPIVRMRNTCIAPGRESFQNLLSGISDGVYAIGMHGGHGGENFSFIPAGGYRIRDGKLGEPVKSFSISGNLFKTLNEIDGITGPDDFGTLAASGENGGCGKFEQWPLPVGMSAPRVRIQKVTVGGLA
tara:strand:+ start:5967 stop:7376 length:1410 start_codon:yes stop_codon:yes gene_type:complete